MMSYRQKVFGTTAIIAFIVLAVAAGVVLNGRTKSSPLWRAYKADDGTTVKFYMLDKDNLCLAKVYDAATNTTAAFTVPCPAVMVEAAPLK